MLRLRRALEYYATSRLCGVAGVWSGRRPCVYVSGADVAGEGEVKLLQHLRHLASSGQAERQSALLVGPDADLLLLALAARPDHATAPVDVLTTDSEGRRKLFRVTQLCAHFGRQLRPKQSHGQGGPERRLAEDVEAYTKKQFSEYFGGTAEWERAAPALPPSGGAGDGGGGDGLASLDFVVVVMLQGNDYLPKLRGAQLQRMWAKLAALGRGAYLGQHLLAPQPNGGILLNLPMFLTLVTGASVASHVSELQTVAGDVAAGEGEEEESGEEEVVDGAELEELEELEVASSGTRGRCDVNAYVRTLLWCAHAYVAGGQQLDYAISYRHPAAPTAAQLEAHFAGIHAWPSYEPPPPDARGTPLRPDAFAMALLPAAAQPYVPAPLQPLMAEGHALSDLFHASPPPVWRPDLVPRICGAVGAVPYAAFSADEREAIAEGAVRVYGIVADDRRLSPLRTPPAPPAGGQPLRNTERVGVMSVPMANEDTTGMGRWAWALPTLATAAAQPAAPPIAPVPPSVPAPSMPAVLAQQPVLPIQPGPPPSGGATPPGDAGKLLLAMLQQPTPAAVPTPSTTNPGAQLLAMLQPQASAATAPPQPCALPVPSVFMRKGDRPRHGD